MCGIYGYLGLRHPDAEVLDPMADALRHRGPDAASRHRDGPCLLGHLRLAINGLEDGDQPLFNQRGDLALVYNGEIYNAPALRRELERRGYRFATGSDGEVICHLYDELGPDLFERLDGMYACALWDSRRQRLLLARDLAGEKPLYLTRTADGGLLFASEIRALRHWPGLDLRLNRQAVWDFPTFLWIPEPATVYQGVEALPRGSLLLVEDGHESRRAIPNRFGPGPLPDDERELTALVERQVTAAVESRLLADVPLGSFLSGGLDSAIVASLAARRLDRLDTFSIGFDDLHDPWHGSADESAAAAELAAHIGSRHHAIHVTAADFRRDLEGFCRHGDQPFAVSSGLGIYTIARHARERGIKVLLSGDGADECFGGYSWYAHLAAPAPAVAGEPGIVSFQNFGLPLERRLATLQALPPGQRAWAWHYYAHETEKARLFHREWQAGLAGSLRHFAPLDAPGAATPEGFIAHDRAFYFPNEMLRKLDRMTMAWSVEGRVPFAAPAILGLAERLDYRWMHRHGQLKWALRRAFSRLLPEAVRQRPKHGFNVPVDHWLKGEWSDLLARHLGPGSTLARLGMIAPDALEVARKMLHDPVRLNGHTLFCYLMLDLWLEQQAAE